jgi:FixJ family two-component response regulator
MSVLDIAMPGMSGLDLQRELTLRQQKIPTVFITAHGGATVHACSNRVSWSAPFSDTALREALNAAFRAS